MARLADVARAAGVSTSTASRALTRPEMVAEPTRRRVLQAADALRFRYNRAARALTTGRTGLIGLVVPTLANPYYSPLVLGAQQAAEELDRHLLLAVSEHSAQREQRLLARLSEQVDGLVMLAPLSSDGELRAISATSPMLLVDRKITGIPSVVVDTAAGVGALADHLLELGHRRIAYIRGPAGTWADCQRCRVVSARVGDELVLLGPLPPTFEAGLTVADQIPGEVTAVIAYNSYLALGLLHALGTLGIRIPDDLSLASADDLAPLGSTTPTVTALRLPIEPAGEVSVRRLCRRADGVEQSLRSTVLRPTLIARRSTGTPAR